MKRLKFLFQEKQSRPLNLKKGHTISRLTQRLEGGHNLSPHLLQALEVGVVIEAMSNLTALAGAHLQIGLRTDIATAEAEADTTAQGQILAVPNMRSSVIIAGTLMLIVILDLPQ